MEAIIEAAGFQYKVKENQKIKIPKIKGKEGDKVYFPVLAIIDEKKVGSPYVEGAKCEAEIIGFGKEKKIIVYKYKAKKRYRRKKGHRTQYTTILIHKIHTE